MDEKLYFLISIIGRLEYRVRLLEGTADQVALSAALETMKEYMTNELGVSETEFTKQEHKLTAILKSVDTHKLRSARLN